MPSVTSSTQTRPPAIHGVSYDAVKPGKAPIPIEVAPKPSQARLELHPSMRPNSSPEPQFTIRPRRSHLKDADDRRDSGLGTAASMKRESKATTIGTDRTDAESTTSAKTRSIRKVPSVPRMDLKSESPSRKSGKLRKVDTASSTASAEMPSITQDPVPRLPDALLHGELPAFSLEDLSEPNMLQFSKRGSLLVKGKRPSTSPSLSPRSSSPALPTIPQIDGPLDHKESERPRTPEASKNHSLLNVPTASPRTVPRAIPRPRRSMQHTVSRLSTIQTRPLTSEEEVLSHRIRTMYEEGTEMPTSPQEREANRKLPDLTSETASDRSTTNNDGSSSPVKTISSQYSRSSVVNPSLPRVLEREENELAGGIEDWQGVANDQVDRYGFINKPPEIAVAVTSPGASYVSLAGSAATAPEGHGMARMATQLKLAAEAPRRSRSIRSRLTARRSSVAGSSRSPDPLAARVSSSERRSFALRPTSSQASYRSAQSSATTRFRRATNHLPQNKARRAIDEAGDMLTLPPGLADVAEAEALRGNASSKALAARGIKERIREEKWRKMAKLVKPAASKGAKPPSSIRNGEHEAQAPSGGGMHFTFDAANAKVISRTWKGIPDRWRATAWWSFLDTSARKTKGSLSEQELTGIFYELQSQSSPDDVQIDLDVPRTIGGHVMFRKRYRGGQRLLFRVLHALSLYFPDPGYVQGMAALAATFLCYFQEELAFVMLVRMWELRGLAKLYRAGFEGLMTALGEFERDWLQGGTVGEKLKELGITPTAYGTRWYLTVFNYSIPFSAQLRVWDVFLLLGDASPMGSIAAHRTTPNTTKPETPPSQEKDAGFEGTLDVLHATSAALIDATREILLDSDFENAMKTLTSWIPIRDEDLLMRVAKVEWKIHRSNFLRGR